MLFPERCLIIESFQVAESPRQGNFAELRGRSHLMHRITVAERLPENGFGYLILAFDSD
jgi:hypothetical protein